MLLWYRFKNFYSFKDEVEVDLRLKKNSSETDYDVVFNGEKVTKVLAVMGANGSGKSNLLKPLAFLHWFSRFSFKDLEPKEKLPLFPHALNKKGASEIEVCFTYLNEESQIFYTKYLCKFTRDRVVHEEVKYKHSKSRQYSTAFSRSIDQNGEQKIKVNKLSFDEHEMFTIKEIETVPSNASIISYYHRKDNEMANFLVGLLAFASNLSVYGKHQFSYSDVLAITENYSNEKEVFKKAVDIMKKMDFGLSDIKLKKEKFIDSDSGEEYERTVPIGIHNNNGKEFKLPFIMESAGTQACYTHLFNLLVSLENGGVAVIDELDSDLHPLMVSEILSMFENEQINTSNAQLIFSCHTPEVLKHLKKHNVYLVEKDSCESTAWRMDDIQGLRSQDNLYNKYITGALGGVPDICL
ncbi:ATP-binding protein [Providencia rettgeri]|uniref:AAA family ATPase n=1 Tax=Providencia TaxID=586 RepID=UPI001EE71EA7|nr:MULTISPECIES: ATP-binding protein [Providencia]MCG5371160.1 ATP-binding protein [Providencia rettgeri]